MLTNQDSRAVGFHEGELEVQKRSGVASQSS